MSESKPFRVCIIGAGLAGLAAAIALRKADREIFVLEQSRMKSEIGAAIHLAPNATKICAKWGLDIQKDANATVCRELRLIHQDGHVLNATPIDAAKMVGAPWLFNHRVDLHTALKNGATGESLPGKPAQIISAAKVVKIDSDQGIVFTESGDQYQADLIIGADGIHSIAREAVIGTRKVAQPSGHSAYRCLIPREKLHGIAEAEEIMSIDHAIFKIILAGDRRVILYPCRGATILNVVAICPDTMMNEASTESWTAQGSTEEMVKTYEGFPSWLTETLSRAEAPGLWQLRDQEPLGKWSKGRLILIGDSAHSMLPHQGQGAGQSVEDAEALGAFFKDVSGPVSLEEVDAILQKVFDARFERASLVQAFSRSSAGVDRNEEGRLQMDPVKFNRYNWSYNGAEDWVARRSQAVAAH